MSRRILLIIYLLCAICAHCRTVWYDRPRPMPRGVTVVDTIVGRIERAIVHVRANGKNWGLRYGDAASQTYYAITLDIPRRQSDDIYVQPAELKVEQWIGTAHTDILTLQVTEGIDLHGGYNSIKIVNDGVSTILYIGAESGTRVAELPPLCDGSQISVIADTDMDCSCIGVDYRSACAAEYSRFDNLGEMNDYLSRSTDPAEGLWEYLDRVIDDSRATQGGRYIVATVRSDQGGYDVVYVSGAAINAADWRPLRIKGHIDETVFDGDYDLDWITADGRVLDDDLSATLAKDGSTLTFKFPVYGAELRFRRMAD